METESVPWHETPEYRAANSRIIFLWGWAQETEMYVKKDWMNIQGRFRSGEDLDEVMRDADLLYESCQSDDWPSQFD